MYICGLEFVTNSVYYKGKTILCSISNDGYSRLWDLNGSAFCPIHEVCSITNKPSVDQKSKLPAKLLFDVVWDPSTQILNDPQHIKLDGCLGKHNESSLASIHSSCQVLVAGINKHIKQKGKPKTPTDCLHPQRPYTAYKPKLSSESCRMLFQIKKSDSLADPNYIIGHVSKGIVGLGYTNEEENSEEFGKSNVFASSGSSSNTTLIG